MYVEVTDLALSWAERAIPHPTHHLIVLSLFHYYFSPFHIRRAEEIEFLVSIFIYAATFFSSLCSALGLFGARASFIMTNGFLYRERIQVLPIKWWRYIIALIKQSYYEPAGAQCHKTGWKTVSLTSIPLVWMNNEAPLSSSNISWAATIKRLYIHAVTFLFSCKSSTPAPL